MKVYLQTFGCRANHYDSEVVRALLEAGGADLVSDPGDADAAVFNSCAVTAAAEADLRHAVRRVARLRPRIATVVMGCASARDPAATARRSIDGMDAPAVIESTTRVVLTVPI